MGIIIYQWGEIDRDIASLDNCITFTFMGGFIENNQGTRSKIDISWFISWFKDQWLQYEFIGRDGCWWSLTILIIIISILCWVFYNSWPNPNGPGWIDDQGRQIPWLGPNGGAEMPGPNGGAEMPGPISKQPPRPQVNTPVELPVESPVGPPVECPNFGDPGIPNKK